MNRIKEFRLKADLTQAQLAEMIGKPQQHISRWENGERTPSVKALMALAKALKCAVTDLIEE
jgi:transcriptional regulator with XRE-family HTH domain